MVKILVSLVFILVSFNSSAALPEFTDLIKKNSPSVVKITTRTLGSSRGLGFENAPPGLKEYLDQFGGNDGNSSGVGSGFVISEDGYVVTNFHVIDGSDEITVRFNDRREYIAEVIGSDASSDIALLKIDETNLPVVEFADSGSIEVGEWVLAIGSPFDLDYSASAGIVSAIGRSLPNGTGKNYVPFIQTDVAINPGNSGGPLFNMEGEVVGINSQILSRSGGFMGLSFAIPASVALDVVGQLRERGSVSRGWLGVSISDLSVEQAKSFGLSKPQGALISQVFAGSPASESGLRAGDIIVEFDGNPIEYSHDLPHVVGLITPGKTVKANVYRQEKMHSIDVTVGELAQEDVIRTSAPRRQVPSGSGGETLGLSLRDIGRRQLSSLGVNGGAEVVDVLDGSPADLAGIQAGDIIVQFNFEDVSSSQQFRSMLGSVESGTVPILFYREGSSIFRTIRVDD